MFVLVSYDIEDDRTRTRLAHKLKDFGRRVQYSVFEAEINEREYAKMVGYLNSVKLSEKDSIRLYRICLDCVEKIQLWGNGKIQRDADFYIA